MKKILPAFLHLMLLGGIVFYVLTMPDRTVIAKPDLNKLAADKANGQYMFYAGGCASCHAKPATLKCDDPNYKDAFDLSGGRCLKTPFGTFYVPNLSPDKKHGIGGWSRKDFVLAMQNGVSPKGKHYYPSFPFTFYQKMTVQDLVDLKAFLDSLAPKMEASKSHDLKFPFTLRRGLGLWKKLYLSRQPFQPKAGQDKLVSRGRYLVEGAGHCGACHSPRTALGGIDKSRRLSGSQALEGEGHSPNLTPHKTGLKSWSAKQIAYGLKTGFTPEYDVFGSAMTKVQENMAHLTDQDRAAIAAYLKALRPIASSK